MEIIVLKAPNHNLEDKNIPVILSSVNSIITEL